MSSPSRQVIAPQIRTLRRRVPELGVHGGQALWHGDQALDVHLLVATLSRAPDDAVVDADAGRDRHESVDLLRLGRDVEVHPRWSERLAIGIGREVGCSCRGDGKKLGEADSKAVLSSLCHVLSCHVLV